MDWFHPSTIFQFCALANNNRTVSQLDLLEGRERGLSKHIFLQSTSGVGAAAGLSTSLRHCIRQVPPVWPRGVKSRTSVCGLSL